jgi:hypothetical protein
MTTLCAWCRDRRAAQGLPPRVIHRDDRPPREFVSHGLCPLCEAELLGVPTALLETSDEREQVRP